MSRPNGWNSSLYDKSFGFIQNMAYDLIDELSPQSGESIIDLGCGTGAMTHEIFRRGAAVEGIDSDYEMVQTAMARYPNIKFRCISGEEFTVKEPVDAVFSNAVLHWIKKPNPVIIKVAAALKPGGRFVAEMGGEGNVKILTESLLYALKEAGVSYNPDDFPWYFPTAQEYSRLLKSEGFEVISIRHFVRPTPLDNCPNGASDWYAMFASKFFIQVEKENVNKIISRATEIASQKLLKNGRWMADYTRLRFYAVRTLG
tara:strand:+ start:70 stop:843 length:774 start_codon:yes stop_codon:yes gene_type:complete